MFEQLQRLETALRDVRRTGLNERAILVLVSHHTKLSQGVCREVLNGLEELRLIYAVSDE